METTIDVENINNILISFQTDYVRIFHNPYICMQKVKKMMKIYEPYYKACKNENEVKKLYNKQL